MPRLVDNLPCDNGSTDSLDSARLAGMMAISGHVSAPLCSRYLIRQEGKLFGVRHPTDFFNKANDPRIFSRDQTICLAAGLLIQKATQEIGELVNRIKEANNRAQNWMEMDGKAKPYGGDIILPHVIQALEMAAGLRSELSILGKLMLKADILVNAWFTPTREPNQLIALCFMAGPEYLQFYKKHTKSWRDAIQDYWEDSFRNEATVAATLERWLDGI